MSETKHGTLTAYTYYKCRCEECKTAWSEYNADRKAARVAEGLAPGDPRHGTKNGYISYGCRCGRCRVAQTDPKFTVEKIGNGFDQHYEVWIKEEGAWFTLGEKVEA